MTGTQFTHRLPDEDRGSSVLAAVWSTLIIGIIVVLFRCYVRWRKNAHSWDDYTIYSALLVCIFCTTVNTIQVHLGFGRHAYYIEATLKKALMWTIVAEIQMNIATALIKTSVCLFILRIIRGTHRSLSVIIVIFIVVVNLGSFALLLVVCFQCFPLRKAWEKDIAGHCIAPSVLANANKGLSVFLCITDLFCALIPVLIFRPLQMKQDFKIALCIIMGLGILTAACAIGQLVTIQFVTSDITWDLVPVEIWSLLLENLGIIVASLPTLHPLFIDLSKSRIWEFKNWYRSQSDTDANNYKDPVKKTFGMQKRNKEAARSDQINLMAPRGITVERSIAVEFASRTSKEVATVDPLDLDHV